MKRILLTIVTCFLLASRCIADSNGLASRITQVTIYLRGARVERTSPVNLKAGNNELVLEGLSNYIDQNSIEVKGKGDATILSVNYRINYTKMQQSSQMVVKLQAALDSTNLSLDFVRNEITTLDQEVQLMQANFKMGVNDKTQFSDDVEEWAQRFHKKVLEIKNAITRLKIKEKDLAASSQELQNQIAQANATVKQPSGEIVVKVLSPTGGVADINFSYYVANAGWTPLYSMRAQNTTDPLKLDYDALVSQYSGETWKDVKLTLCTGNPMLGGNKPELQPWLLSIINNYGRTRNAEMMDGDKAGGAYYEQEPALSKANSKDEAKAMQSAADYVSVSQGQLNVNFDINLRYSIAPDGTPQQVRIQQLSLPAIYSYAAAPKLDKDAFLQARVTGWEDANLLPGIANLYFEGAYIGKSSIDPTVTNDTLNLSFGRDKKINIERKLLRDFSKKAFIGKMKTQNFVYEYSIKNTKNTDITLTIEDQIPISQDKDIDVTMKENNGAEFDSKSGKLQWKLSLKPGEVKKLKLKYSVKYPGNKFISGL